MIQIKRNNEVFYTIEDVCEGSKLSRQLMDHHYVILKFSTAEPVYFEIGDSVEIPGFGYFELTSAYFPKYNDSTDGYDYELQMDAYYMAWKNKICKYRPQYGANETSFKLTTTVGVHLNVILNNLKALGYKYNGLDFAVDYTTYNKGAFDVDKRFYIEYGSISILDALNAICDENALDCEWWVDGNIIYLGYCEMTGQVTFEQGVDMLSMSYSESKSSYITRLYAFGSDKNIPTGYFTGSDADVTTDGIATDYLMLPNNEVDSDGFYSKDGYLENTNVVKNEKQAIEGVVMFDDEYPKVECTVSGIKTYDSTVEENGEKKTQTFWQVTSKDSFATNFTKSWIKRNLTLMIKFTSGALMGMEFDVEYKIIEQVNYFEIVANETYGRSLPDGVMCPKEGDTFFLYNWDATKITETNLIQEAQDALYERAKVYYLKSMIDNSNFTCVLDAVKFYNHGVYNYHPLGEQVKLINPMFSDVDANGKHYRNSRIIGMDIKLDIPYDEPTYIVGEKAASSRLSKLEDKVTSITVNGIQIGGTGSGGGGVYVIGLNDSTPATDSNVYSARRVDQNYANKYREEYIREIYTFAKGLISDMLAKLNGGATFGTGGYKFDENGNVVVDALSSRGFDEALERGFGIKKNAQGKYTLSVTDLMVWGKAVFNSLEIRKLYAVGGNVYLSGASSKLQHVSPVTDADGEVTGWKCYILGDDGTTATQNGWARYDQAKCQTFDIKEGVYENVSNTYYWRLVTDVSTENETITETYTDADGKEQTRDLYDGKKFGWVILSKTDCESSTNDAPKAGDTIVLDGHRMFASGDADGRDQYNDESRTNVMMLETTGTEDGTLPRIVALTGIVDYKHWDGVNDYSNTVFILSPKEVVFVSSSFKFMSASGDPITLVNFRGNWAEGTEYRYYDQVSHGNAIWTCIVKKGDTTNAEPSDTSTDWRKEISGGKGEKGDKGDPGTPGKDAVTYGVQVTPTYEVWSDAKKHAGIVLTFTKTTGSTMLKYPNVQALGTAKLYVDGTELEGLNKWVNGGSNKIIFDSFTFDGTNNTPTIGTASVISIELIVDGKIVATANYANGKQGADGPAATVYTIEAVGNYNNNSGTLVDASTIGVTLTGDLKLYKTVGSEKTEDSKPPQCWRLTVGGKNVDGTIVFTNTAGNNIVTYQYYNTYKKDSNGNIAVPGSATISVYKDSSMGELLASLVIPITLNPGAIVNVDAKLGKIESTTASMKGTIETIQQGQGQISLKVQGLERKSRNILSGGNVIGLFNKQYEVFRSLPFVMEKGRTYTVTARLWMESNSNERHVTAFVFGSDNNWTYAYSSAYFTKTSADYLRFKFEAGATRQMVVAFYEQNSSRNDPGSGNYNGVHVDWVRVDEGDWTGVDANGRTLDKWEPSEEETNAVNLLPDPAFSASIGYTDGMGERNTFVGSMGDAVPWMSRDPSADGDGCRGVTFERSGYSDPEGANNDSYAGLRYIVPFRGAGTYCISFVYTDLSQTLSGKPDMDEVVVMEVHPCDADKYRITAGFNTGGRNTSSTNSGIIRAQNYKTFGETATDGSGRVKKIAYLEVRVLLRGNGSVRVSRLCLSKSDHFIYWNANDVSKARKKEAALLATGIDIDSETVTMTGRNFVWQDNAGAKVAYMDDKGNATFNGVINATGGNFTGTVTGSTINGSTINGSTINSTSSDGKSTTKIEGGLITTNNITAKGGSVSFFKFDSAGMYSGSIEQDGKIYSGLGMSMDNLSVSGNNNRRISSVFLGHGTIDSRFTNSDNRTVYRVGSTIMGSTFYNYIKLERIGSGSFSFENSPEHAALGIETQGDFCLAALGGPSLFAGMCFASNTGGSFGADKKHCFYLCEGGRFYMPNDPPNGMLIVVIQTGGKITFYGNGHDFHSGTNSSGSCNSNAAGQWTLFYYDGNFWNTVYMNGRPW